MRVCTGDTDTRIYNVNISFVFFGTETHLFIPIFDSLGKLVRRDLDDIQVKTGNRGGERIFEHNFSVINVRTTICDVVE